ncbi:MipA/OmpV family protein [Vibrio sp. SS-MA-C1-2]|nr:MipA/OmpV family protein [Vibrio sp. SS-MA-C1-2]UJF19850.1 MipA/OmpV family protein [Vibrio sp. SS-MA-C1-2]
MEKISKIVVTFLSLLFITQVTLPVSANEDPPLSTGESSEPQEKNNLDVDGYTSATKGNYVPRKWSLGVLAAFSPGPYRDTDNAVLVVPAVGYEGEHFFLRGLVAGYRIFPRESRYNLTLGAIYDPRRFDPDDSDNEMMKKLDKRDASGLGYLNYQQRIRYNQIELGTIELGGGIDLSGLNNGVYGQVGWKYSIYHGFWGVTPEIGYSYNNDDLNARYYGISDSESEKSGFDSYSPGSSGQFFISLNSYIMLGERVRLMGESVIPI